MENKDKIEVWTDGSSRGNPGPGGYGVVLCWKGKRKELSGGFRRTTNNRMELMAVIVGLSAITRNDLDVVVYTDSRYVCDAVMKEWVFGWEKKGFSGKKNPDLWNEYLTVSRRLKSVEIRWVKGHIGTELNERCDQLATSAPCIAADTIYESLNII
jgi:ribonuclease HI